MWHNVVAISLLQLKEERANFWWIQSDLCFAVPAELLKRKYLKRRGKIIIFIERGLFCKELGEQLAENL